MSQRPVFRATAIAIALAAGALTFVAAPTQAADKVKIGFVSTLSGPSSALGIDIRDSPASAQAFMSDFRITYPSLNDPSDNLALDFRNTVPPAGIPTTLVISRSGRISARVIGGATYNGLKSLIQRAAAEPA